MAHIFRGLVHYHGVTWWHAGRYGVGEVRYLTAWLSGKGSGLSHWVCLAHILDLKVHLHSDTLPPTRPHLLQQATPPNSVTPFSFKIISGPLSLITIL